ncbi:MAG: hypothetical protein FJX62_20220 [Alphaproteobacteria bacterium]|nr:hypothetical protein [Alphaproteobacteria bacterium]
MSDSQSHPQIPPPPARPRRRIAGFIFLMTLAGFGLGGYFLWLKLEQISTMIAGPVAIVTVAGGAVAAFVLQLRNMSAGEIFDVIGEAFYLVFAAIGAVFRGIWNWFLGLIGLD